MWGWPGVSGLGDETFPGVSGYSAGTHTRSGAAATARSDGCVLHLHCPAW